VILDADRPDLTVESLVVDGTKAYHDLFTDSTRKVSAERLPPRVDGLRPPESSTRAGRLRPCASLIRPRLQALQHGSKGLGSIREPVDVFNRASPGNRFDQLEAAELFEGPEVVGDVPQRLVQDG